MVFLVKDFHLASENQNYFGNFTESADERSEEITLGRPLIACLYTTKTNIPEAHTTVSRAKLSIG